MPASLTMAALIAVGKLGTVKVAIINLSFNLLYEKLAEYMDDQKRRMKWWHLVSIYIIRFIGD